MDDVNFPGWQPEKSIQVVEGNGRTRVLVKGRRLSKTIRAMEALSRHILFATTPDTQRFKPIKGRDLRLI